ncbi:MAG: hypothetical protein QXK42_01975 [Candidatus Korarchaeum sp.]
MENILSTLMKGTMVKKPEKTEKKEKKKVETAVVLITSMIDFMEEMKVILSRYEGDKVLLSLITEMEDPLLDLINPDELLVQPYTALSCISGSADKPTVYETKVGAKMILSTKPGGAPLPVNLRREQVTSFFEELKNQCSKSSLHLIAYGFIYNQLALAFVNFADTVYFIGRGSNTTIISISNILEKIAEKGYNIKKVFVRLSGVDPSSIRPVIAKTLERYPLRANITVEEVGVTKEKVMEELIDVSSLLGEDLEPSV